MIRARDRIALAYPPLLLRLGLAVTFVWAGAGKLFDRVTVRGGDAAVLIAMGVQESATGGAGGAGGGASGGGGGGGGVPIRPLPPADGPGAKDAPGKGPGGKDAPGKEGPGKEGPGKEPPGKDGPTKDRTSRPTRSERPPTRVGQGDGGVEGVTEGAGRLVPVADVEGGIDPNTGLVVLNQASRGDARRQGGSPANQPQVGAPGGTAGGGNSGQGGPGVEPTAIVRRMHASITLRVHRAANPAPDAKGHTPPAIYPGVLAAGARPALTAWTISLMEFVGGLMLLVGMFTRLNSLALAGVMAGAIWLDQLGPAFQSGQVVLGFLPDRDPFDPRAWSLLLWQFMLVLSCLALFLLGPGVAALDRVLFPAGGGGGTGRGANAPAGGASGGPAR